MISVWPFLVPLGLYLLLCACFWTPLGGWLASPFDRLRSAGDPMADIAQFVEASMRADAGSWVKSAYRCEHGPTGISVWVSNGQSHLKVNDIAPRRYWQRRIWIAYSQQVDAAKAAENRAKLNAIRLAIIKSGAPA